MIKFRKKRSTSRRKSNVYFVVNCSSLFISLFILVACSSNEIKLESQSTGLESIRSAADEITSEAMKERLVAILTPSTPDTEELDRGKSTSKGQVLNETKSQQQSLSKSTIDSMYETELETLRADCMATSTNLLDSIIGELQSNEEAIILTLQQKNLGKLLIAEEACDTKFNGIVYMAQLAYAEANISALELPDWRSQYEQEKSRVRAEAIAKLTAAIK